MSWGQELWDRVDAVIGQLTEDTDELAGLFTRWVIGVGFGDMVILVIKIILAIDCQLVEEK